MFKKLLNKNVLKNEKGMTLIELLAVIVILAIVAAIAVPAIGNIIDNSRIKAGKADVANVLNAANIYFTDNPSDDSADQTELEPYIESAGILEGATAYAVAKNNSGNQLTVTTPTTLEVGTKTVTITAATLNNIDLETNKTATGFAFTD